jgi:hypothetical protein
MINDYAAHGRLADPGRSPDRFRGDAPGSAFSAHGVTRCR